MKKICSIFSFILIFLSLTACKNKEITIKALSPNGAPALAQIQLEDKKTITKDISYEVQRVSDTTLLAAGFTNKSYDVIIAPINLGAKFYNINKAYALGTVVTWGNLYFASCSENFTLQSLHEKDIYLFGEGSINQFVIEDVLKENQIEPASTTYLASTADTKNRLIAEPNSICLIAEPVLSATTAVLKQQGHSVTKISVQDLWSDSHDGKSYPQAGVFFNQEWVNNNSEEANTFLTSLDESITFCNENIDEVSELATKLQYGLPGAGILKNAIPNSNIKFIKGKDCIIEVETILTSMGIAVEKDFFIF